MTTSKKSHFEIDKNNCITQLPAPSFLLGMEGAGSAERMYLLCMYKAEGALEIFEISPILSKCSGPRESGVSCY